MTLYPDGNKAYLFGGSSFDATKQSKKLDK